MGGRMVAISGKSGCGNTTVSRLLAEKLGFGLVNYTFRNMAQEYGLPLERILEMAADDFSFDRQLDARQVELARAGDRVIGSRLAIWLLPDADLRVYLYADLEIRAARIRSREGGETCAVLATTMARDERDHSRFMSVYGIDNDDYSFADLVINAGRFHPEAITDVVIAALESASSPARGKGAVI
jgi:cytidylate kinase